MTDALAIVLLTALSIGPFLAIARYHQQAANEWLYEDSI